MPWQAITSNTETVDGIVLAPTDGLFVAAGATLWSTSFTAVTSNAVNGDSPHMLRIAGHVFSVSNAISLTGNVNANAHDILVAPGGSIIGGFSGLQFQGTARVVNHGFVSGGTYGVVMARSDVAGTTTVVVNSGRIEGKVGGVIIPNGNETAAYRIENTGVIRGDVWAILLAPSTAAQTVRNEGRIEGDVVFGAGNDFYDGRGGTVTGTIRGAAGNDTFVPGAEEETFDGGTGTDTLDFRGARAVTLSLANTLPGTGRAEGDTYTGIENVLGSRGNDRILGSSGANVLAGRGGNDTLEGLDGNDTLIGGTGDDQLDGGRGADRLNGGAGSDTMTGGPGNDTFIFASPADAGDTITDFSNAAGNDDRFEISAAGFGAGLVAGVLPAFRFVARPDNVAQSANHRFIYDTATRTVWYDEDGNGGAAPVLLAAFGQAVTLTAADFMIV